MKGNSPIKLIVGESGEHCRFVPSLDFFPVVDQNIYSRAQVAGPRNNKGGERGETWRTSLQLINCLSASTLPFLTGHSVAFHCTVLDGVRGGSWAL